MSDLGSCVVAARMLKHVRGHRAWMMAHMTGQETVKDPGFLHGILGPRFLGLHAPRHVDRV